MNLLQRFQRCHSAIVCGPKACVKHVSTATFACSGLLGVNTDQELFRPSKLAELPAHCNSSHLTVVHLKYELFTSSSRMPNAKIGLKQRLPF